WGRARGRRPRDRIARGPDRSTFGTTPKGGGRRVAMLGSVPDSPTRSPLISAKELQRLVEAEPGRLRIVDCRWYLGRPGAGRAAYAAGHLPGAIHLDLDDDLADIEGFGAPGRHPLPSPAAFAARLGAVGIGDEHVVIGYDDVGGWVAARLWWMLDVLGHREVAVLDGGIEAWTAADGTLSTEAPAWPP